MQGVLRRIALLKHVWHEALPYQGQPLTAPVTPAQLSCDVLTQLASLLQQYSLQGDLQGMPTLKQSQTLVFFFSKVHVHNTDERPARRCSSCN